jgi:hypothetical protein
MAGPIIGPNVDRRSSFTFALCRMHSDIALSLCRELRDGRCLFGYSGGFSDEHSVRLIELASAVGSVPDTGKGPRGRLGYVMVEAFQNIVRHRADTSGMAAWGDARSLFLLCPGEAGQWLHVENAVTLAQQQKLEGLLMDLRNRTPEELKERFMEGIQRANAPGARGAGLGLIEMARRSAGRLAWSFHPIAPSHSRFAMTLELGEPPSMGTTEAADLRTLAMHHEWELFFTGRWNRAVQEVLLELAGAQAGPGQLVDRIGAWLVHATPSFFIVHGGGKRMLSLGGLMHPESARLMAERTELPNGSSLAARPADGRILVVAELVL